MTNDGFWLYVSPETAVEMFFLNKLDLSMPWQNNQPERFLDLLTAFNISEILSIIDSADHTALLASEEIPQFAEAPNVIDSVVSTICNCGKDSVGYEDLGYYLIREDRKTLTYRKYGENYGKGATYLGLLCKSPGSFKESALSRAYIEHVPSDQRQAFQTKMLLRIPLIQELLWRAKDAKYNGYDSMRMFSMSTMIRRGQCPRWMLPALRRLKCKELDRRIDNIFWQE